MSASDHEDLRQITLTFGSGAAQTSPWTDVRTIAWGDLAALLTRHAVGAKDGACFTPAVFPTGRRKKADATRIEMIVLDSDSGSSLSDISSALRSLGWAGVISSTHSHLANTTLVKRGAYEAWLQKRGVAGENPASAPQYLTEVKGLLAAIASGATVEVQDETYLIFHHQPCPKIREVLPLARPWLANAYDDQKQATQVWEDRYGLAARHLGLQHDRSCSDTSRLFYLPRHPLNGPPAEAEVIDGEWIDVFALESFDDELDAEPAARRSRQSKSGKTSRDGRASGATGDQVFKDRKTGELFDLRRWAAGSAATFKIVDALNARSPGAFIGRLADGVRHHITCPNAAAHSSQDQDAATFVCDPGGSDDAKGFVIHCRHGHCTGLDRLLFLKQMLEQSWLTLEDLVDPRFGYSERSNSREARRLSIGSDAEIAECVAQDLTDRYGKVIQDEGEFWKYSTTHWEPINAEELWSAVARYDGAGYPNGRGNEAIIRLGKTRIESGLACLVQLLRARDFFRTGPRGINCASGFITFGALGQPELLRHHREHRQRHVLAGSWPGNQSKPNSTSLMHRFLHGCFNGDDDEAAKIELLGEIAGISAAGLATRIKSPKAVVLVGRSTENGKSQVLAMHRSLLPRDAVSSISPTKFSDQTFICHLAGKLLNAPDELAGSDAISSDVFKQVVTGDPVTGREVYRSAVEFEPMAQHIFATNSLPSFKGGVDRGVRRRLMVLVFNRVIPPEERVERIGARVGEEEPDLLLQWAVEGASRVIRRGHFSEPESSVEALLDWIYSSDPVLAWMESDQVEYARPNVTLEAKVSEAYGKFLRWAGEEGFDKSRLPAVNVFSQRVLGAGKGVERRRLSNGSRFTGMAAIGAALDQGLSSFGR
ncbi:MAG: putative Phage/plasmid primase [Rubritepida sp.]|nr:putative Phage/plasmid primase [Rubritepida sp.]